MQVAIRVGNYKTIVGQIQGKLAALAAKAGDAVQGAGIDCEAGAKQACPVDTGRLRSSITYTKTSQLSCTVGTNVFYGPYIEFGTHKMAPRPFLFPAYLAARKSLIAELKASLA